MKSVREEVKSEVLDLVKMQVVEQTTVFARNCVWNQTRPRVESPVCYGIAGPYLDRVRVALGIELWRL